MRATYSETTAAAPRATALPFARDNVLRLAPLTAIVALAARRPCDSPPRGRSWVRCGGCHPPWQPSSADNALPTHGGYEQVMLISMVQGQPSEVFETSEGSLRACIRTRASWSGRQGLRATSAH